MEDAKDRKPSSHIWKHWALNHPNELVQPKFEFKVLNCHRSSLDRQIMEAIRISSDGELNSKCEWRQNQIKRISVHLTDHELEMVEKELASESQQIKTAIDNLSVKLDLSNKSKKSQVSTNPFILESSDIDITHKSKRKLTEFSQNTISKRVKRMSSNTLPESKVIMSEPSGTLKQPIAPSMSKGSMITTFAQAAAKAKIFNIETYGKNTFSETGIGNITKLDFDFSNMDKKIGSLSISSCSSSSSSPNKSLPIMEPLSLTIEQEISLNLSAVCLEPRAANLSDSFSSNPDSNFNKTAETFCLLVEDAVAKLSAKNKELNFERLLVQMMDLGIDNTVSSAFCIPQHLENMGWSFKQFETLWTVGTSMEQKFDSWSRESLESVGGKGALGRIWAELKDDGLARMEKRKSPEDDEWRPSSPIKYRRMQDDGPSYTFLTPDTSKIFKNIANKPSSSTPDAKQSLLTDWVKTERKIGERKDRTLPKKNPHPLIPPCGPTKIQRRLFKMKDAPEDLNKTLEAAASLQKRPTPVSPPSPTIQKKPPVRSYSSSSSSRPPSSSSRKPTTRRRSSNPSYSSTKPKPASVERRQDGRLFEKVPSNVCKQEIASYEVAAAKDKKKKDDKTTL